MHVTDQIPNIYLHRKLMTKDIKLNFAQLADEGGNEIVTFLPGADDEAQMTWSHYNGHNGGIIMGTNGRATPNMERDHHLMSSTAIHPKS